MQEQSSWHSRPSADVPSFPGLRIALSFVRIIDFELFKITQAYEKMQIAQYSEALIHTLIEFNFETKSNIWQMPLPDDWLSELCFFIFQPVLLFCT